MWMILELARVWENCVFLVFSLRRTSVWGSDPGRLCRWLKARQEQKYSISISFFISLICIYIFLHFPADSLIVVCVRFYAWILKPVFPASSWAGRSSEYLSPCLLCYSEHGSWIIPPEKISEMFRIHTGPLCYRPAHGYIDSAGLLSVEECAALHASRIHGLYFHFAGHFY